MKLTDAERERLYSRLQDHYAAGSLDVAALEAALERVSSAGSREEAASVFADLPPLPAEPAPPAERVSRRRGHGDAERPAPDWRPTAERFRDPRSGRVMRVWEDPAGNRHYVPDDSA